MSRLLIVEDDETLGDSLVERLRRESYDVVLARSVSEALHLVARERFCLALVDVGLPDGSGFAVAREIKAKGETPVIFLTAMNSAEYRLEGFELGADDYIPKPFHLRELLLRVQKVMDGGRASSVQLRSEGMTLWADSLRVEFGDGRMAQLSPRDFRLLFRLVEVSPVVVSRGEVVREIWKGEEETTHRTVDNSVVRIRAVLGKVGERCLQSVRGVGYRWSPPRRGEGNHSSPGEEP